MEALCIRFDRGMMVWLDARSCGGKLADAETLLAQSSWPNG
jgi:hypothetical protein